MAELLHKVKRGIKIKRNAGVAFSLVLILTAVLVIAGAAFVKMTGSEITMTRQQMNSTKAFYLAEAGVELAKYRLHRLDINPDYEGEPAPVSLGDGEFVVNVSTPENNPDWRLIVSTGHVPGVNSTSTFYQERRIQVLVELTEEPIFGWTAFTEESITLSGIAMTDSYDSSLGPYGNGNVGSNGDVASNAIKEATISLSGTSLVNGDAIVGLGGDPKTAIEMTGGSVITGTKAAAYERVDNPAVEIPDDLENGGELKIKGNETLTLPGGTYWYSSIDIGGSGQLILTEPATIYVSGDVSVGGNGITTSENLPTNLTLMVAGEQGVTFGGGANFYGGIYAPNSQVKISGDLDIFGAVISRGFELKGTALHFDEGFLEGGGRDTYTVTVLKWQEGL